MFGHCLFSLLNMLVKIKPPGREAKHLQIHIKSPAVVFFIFIIILFVCLFSQLNNFYYRSQSSDPAKNKTKNYYNRKRSIQTVQMFKFRIIWESTTLSGLKVATFLPDFKPRSFSNSGVNLWILFILKFLYFIFIG